MLQTGTETMSVGLVQAESVIVVNEAGTVIQERGLFALFLDIILRAVIQVVGPERHLVLEQIPGTVRAAHPGSRDAVRVAPTA